MSVAASERDALKVLRELGKANAGAIGRELGFSAEYANVLCRSLWRNAYVRGTTVSGYELTEKGEKFLLEWEEREK